MSKYKECMFALSKFKKLPQTGKTVKVDKFTGKISIYQ